MAHFIARLAPGLDRYPEASVYMRDMIGDSEFMIRKMKENKSKTSPDKYEAIIELYRCLKNKFFDKELNLNARKARVQNLLGADNAWIKTRLENY